METKKILVPTERNEWHYAPMFIDSIDGVSLCYNSYKNNEVYFKDCIYHHLHTVSGEELKDGDYFLWINNAGEMDVFKYHSDAGYGIKTYEDFNEEDGSSMIVKHSGKIGKIIESTDSSLTDVTPIEDKVIFDFIEEYNESLKEEA